MLLVITIPGFSFIFHMSFFIVLHVSFSYILIHANITQALPCLPWLQFWNAFRETAVPLGVANKLSRRTHPGSTAWPRKESVWQHWIDCLEWKLKNRRLQLVSKMCGNQSASGKGFGKYIHTFIKFWQLFTINLYHFWSRILGSFINPSRENNSLNMGKCYPYPSLYINKLTNL